MKERYGKERVRETASPKNGRCWGPTSLPLKISLATDISHRRGLRNPRGLNVSCRSPPAQYCPTDPLATSKPLQKSLSHVKPFESGALEHKKEGKMVTQRVDNKGRSKFQRDPGSEVSRRVRNLLQPLRNPGKGCKFSIAHGMAA